MDNTNRNTESSVTQDQNTENDRNRQSGISNQSGQQGPDHGQTRSSEGVGGGDKEITGTSKRTIDLDESEEDDETGTGTKKDSSQKTVSGDESQMNVK